VLCWLYLIALASDGLAFNTRATDMTLDRCIAQHFGRGFSLWRAVVAALPCLCIHFLRVGGERGTGNGDWGMGNGDWGLGNKEWEGEWGKGSAGYSAEALRCDAGFCAGTGFAMRGAVSCKTG